MIQSRNIHRVARSSSGFYNSTEQDGRCIVGEGVAMVMSAEGVVMASMLIALEVRLLLGQPVAAVLATVAKWVWLWLWLWLWLWVCRWVCLWVWLGGDDGLWGCLACEVLFLCRLRGLH